MPQVVYQHFTGTDNYTISTGFTTFEMDRLSGSFPAVGYRVTRAQIKFSRINVQSIYRALQVYSNSDGINNSLVSTQAMQNHGLTSTETYTDVVFDCDTSINYAALTRINLRSLKGSASSEGAVISVRSSSTITIIVDYEVLQSDLTLDKTSLDAGQIIRANISAGDPAYWHRVTWRFGWREQVDTVAAGTLYKDFTIPDYWLDQIPAALQGAMSVTLETISGSTVVGSVTAYATVAVGAGVVPSIGSLTASKVNNAVPPAWDLYLAGISQALLTMGGVSAGMGSNIVAYSITGPGLSINAAQGATSILPVGILTYTATVTDQRGRTASKTVQITVVDYTKPFITGVSSSRCDSAGNQNGSGTYIKALMNYYLSSPSGKNSATVDIKYRQRGVSTWITAFNGAMASGGSKVIGAGNIDIMTSYEVQYTVTDALGYTAVYIDTVGTAEVLLHKRAGGKGLGVGKYGETDGQLQIGLEVLADKEIKSATQNMLRGTYGLRGFILRSDGEHLNFLTTNPGDVNGIWRELYPLIINLSTGDVYVGTTLMLNNPLAIGSGGTGASDAPSALAGLVHRGVCLDANIALNMGIYTVTTSTINLPAGNQTYGTLVALLNNGAIHDNVTNWLSHILITTNYGLFYRGKINNNEFGIWQRIALSAV